MTHIHKLLVVAALAAGGSAFAADATGVYLLAGGGVSKFNGDCTGTSACDNNGSSQRFIVGYRLGNGIAIEGVALNFGKATATVPFGNVNVAAELKSKGAGAGVAFYADFSPSWTAALRVGALSIKGTTVVSATGISGSESKTSTQAYLGLGVAYRFTEMVSVELAADSSRAKFSGDETANVSAYTLNLGIRF